MLQLLYVLLAVEFHLFHDLLLGVDLSLQVLLLGQGVIQLVLEVLVLLGQNLIRLLGSLQLYLYVLGEEHLILEVAPFLEEFGIGSRVLLLLLLKPLDPLLPRLLLTSQHILQRLDLLLQLLLSDLKLPLYCSFLDFYVLIGSLKLDNALVQVLDLPGPLVQLLVLVPDHVL